MNVKEDIFQFFDKWNSEFITEYRFAADELAFLAVTSKFECQLRDLIACYFHSIAVDKGYIVAREWGKRVDLTLLSATDSEKPVALIEFKAVSSASTVQNYGNALMNDFMKLKNLDKEGKVDKYLILSVNLLEKEMASTYKNAVKYVNSYVGINFNTITEAVNVIHSNFPSLAFHPAKTMELGNYYGTKIQIVAFVMGPF